MLLFLIGCGFGCMPPLAATALQNNVSIHTFGSAVATMQFSRNLLATMLVAVFGVLVLTGMDVAGGKAVDQYSVDGFRPRVPRGRRKLRDLAGCRRDAATKSRCTRRTFSCRQRAGFCAILLPLEATRRRRGKRRRSAPARRERHDCNPQVAVCRIGHGAWRSRRWHGPRPATLKANIRSVRSRWWSASRPAAAPMSPRA